jgi:hypothetical protein
MTKLKRKTEAIGILATQRIKAPALQGPFFFKKRGIDTFNE